MKARKSFGEDYDCQMNWPDGIFLQCGEKGIVISRNKNKPNYQTAFFEAFPKEPSTFIRGEGVSLEEAEKNAFKKYERIINCVGHDYKRKDESEHGICIHCNLFTSNCFPPKQSCSVCKQHHVNYSFDNQWLCENHYMELSKKELDNFKVSDNQNSKDDETRALKFELEYGLYLRLMKKYGFVNTSVPEYQEKHRIEKMHYDFELFSKNKMISVFNNLNKGKSEEEKLKIRMIDSIYLMDDLFLSESLYEEVFKECYKIESLINNDEEMKNYCLSYHKNLNLRGDCEN